MTDKSVHIFFDNYAHYLNDILVETDIEKSKRRAQVMLTQLNFFKETCLNKKGETPLKDALALGALLDVKGVDSFFNWFIEKQTFFEFEYCLFRSEKTTWRHICGTPRSSSSGESLEWIEKGRYGKKVLANREDFHFFVVGEERLVFGGKHSGVPDLSLFLKLVDFVFPRVVPVFEKVDDSSPNDPLLIAQDGVTKQLLQKLKNAAVTDVTILLEGESGSGKEVLANFIHQNSSRKKKNFVAVNCAAIPEGLIESELFGHEKGAFTGAVQTHIGKVETANNGTLFLDEIGEMDFKAQAKLLRFIQLKEFHRVGGKEKISVNVRIIAATNKDLRKAVKEQVFRDDLFFRLSVMPFRVPPLRERLGDLLPLFSFFLRRYAREFKIPLPKVTQQVQEILFSHPFYGNIRELENLVQNVLVQSQGEEITRSHLPASLFENIKTSPLKSSTPLVFPSNSPPSKQSENLFIGLPEIFPQTNQELKQAKQLLLEKAKEAQLQLEKDFLENILGETGWNIPEASKRSGINRTMLYKMMDRTGLKN